MTGSSERPREHDCEGGARERLRGDRAPVCPHGGGAYWSTRDEMPQSWAHLHRHFPGLDISLMSDVTILGETGGGSVTALSSPCHFLQIYHYFKGNIFLKKEMKKD